MEGEKKGTERGMMEGMDVGTEDYPCMHKHKFTQPGWA